MTDTTQWQIIEVTSDHLYFDRYVYSFVFEVHDLGCVRRYQQAKSIDDITDLVYNNYQRRQNFRIANWGGRWKSVEPDSNEIMQQKLQTLTRLAMLLKANQDQIKLINHNSSGHLYTNNIDLIKWAGQIPGVLHTNQIKKNVVSQPKNTLVLQASDYCYRSYFSNSGIDASQRNQLANFLSVQDNLQLSRSLQSWLTRNIAYTFTSYSQRHFFIDHSNLGVLTMLQIICPGLIRKTLDIVVVNN